MPFYDNNILPNRHRMYSWYDGILKHNTKFLYFLLSLDIFPWEEKQQQIKVLLTNCIIVKKLKTLSATVGFYVFGDAESESKISLYSLCITILCYKFEKTMYFSSNELYLGKLFTEGLTQVTGIKGD